ncbi:hypothetical protein XENOCAPTIV_002448 [Xenoophorus captivus]|uniref:Uncharacterized protein n=1 Tax=Xenoophorus captivus TaxID=1517983 RepID=A0ABV0RK18_9TELE
MDLFSFSLEFVNYFRSFVSILPIKPNPDNRVPTHCSCGKSKLFDTQLSRVFSPLNSFKNIKYSKKEGNRTQQRLGLRMQGREDQMKEIVGIEVGYKQGTKEGQKEGR